MQSFHYAHFPPHLSTIYIALYSDVTNSSLLRQRLISASIAPGPEGDLDREAVNFAFIEARLVRSSIPCHGLNCTVTVPQITSLQHLQTAIYQALLADSQDSLRTKTIHSEILWALSPNNNVCISANVCFI